MNKIQYIKLLALRGIFELKGTTIAEAVRQSGGDPSDKEMVKVNEDSMKYYAEQWEEEKEKNKVLLERVKRLERRDEILSALEAGGVDNWVGYDDAFELYNLEN